MATETEIDYVGHGYYLELGKVTIDARRIAWVRWRDRQRIATHGHYVEAREATVFLALPGGGLGRVEVNDPAGVQRLRHWLRLWTCYETRAA